MTNYLDTDGLFLYDSKIKEYIRNTVDESTKTFPITILTSNATLEDDIGVGRAKLFFVNNSSTISLTMPGDSSRKYVVVALNVIAAALVSAGKNPQYNLVNGGASQSLTWTSAAEPYLLVVVLRLS